MRAGSLARIGFAALLAVSGAVAAVTVPARPAAAQACTPVIIMGLRGLDDPIGGSPTDPHGMGDDSAQLASNLAGALAQQGHLASLEGVSYRTLSLPNVLSPNDAVFQGAQQDALQQITQQQQQCPGSLIVIIAQSAGAAVIHQLLNQMNQGTFAVAILMGDPLHTPTELYNRNWNGSQWTSDDRQGFGVTGKGLATQAWESLNNVTLGIYNLAPNAVPQALSPRIHSYCLGDDQGGGDPVCGNSSNIVGDQGNHTKYRDNVHGVLDDAVNFALSVLDSKFPPPPAPQLPQAPYKWLSYWGTPTAYDSRCPYGARDWANGVAGTGTWGTGWKVTGLPPNTPITLHADVRCDGTATSTTYEVDDPQGGHHWFKVNQLAYDFAPLGTWTSDANGNLNVQMWNGDNPGGQVVAADLVATWDGGSCNDSGNCQSGTVSFERGTLGFWGAPTAYDGTCPYGSRTWANGVAGAGTWGTAWSLYGLPPNTPVTIEADVRCDGTATRVTYEVDDPQGGHHWFQVNQMAYDWAPLGTWTTNASGELLVQMWNGGNPGGQVVAAPLRMTWNQNGNTYTTSGGSPVTVPCHPLLRVCPQ